LDDEAERVVRREVDGELVGAPAGGSRGAGAPVGGRALARDAAAEHQAGGEGRGECGQRGADLHRHLLVLRWPWWPPGPVCCGGLVATGSRWAGCPGGGRGARVAVARSAVAVAPRARPDGRRRLDRRRVRGVPSVRGGGGGPVGRDAEVLEQ